MVPAASAQTRRRVIPTAKPAIIGYDGPPKVGEKGKLWEGRFKVIQIVDENNVIGEIEYFRSRDVPGQETVWITRPTDGLIDGRRYIIQNEFEAIGTKSYTALTGKRTILHLQLLPLEDKDSKKSKK